MPELREGRVVVFVQHISSCCARNRKKYLLLAIGLKRSSHLPTAFNLQFVPNLCPERVLLFFVPSSTLSIEFFGVVLEKM